MNRTRNNKTWTRRFILILATLVAVPSMVMAQDSGWNLRLRGAVVSSDEAFSVDNSAGGNTIAGGNAAPGFGVAVEKRWTSRLGLELGALYAKVPDTDVTDTAGTRTEVDEGPGFLPVTASLNIHLTPGRKVDVYVAPTVAFARFDDFDLEVDGQTVSYKADDQFAWGASAGADVHLGERWSLNAAVTYLDLDMEVTEVGASSTPVVVEFNPVIVSAGATLRF